MAEKSRGERGQEIRDLTDAVTAARTLAALYTDVSAIKAALADLNTRIGGIEQGLDALEAPTLSRVQETVTQLDIAPTPVDPVA